MAIVKTKPTSAGRRFVVKVVDPDLYKGAPYAPLLEKKSKKAAATTTATLRPGIPVAGISSVIV